MKWPWSKKQDTAHIVNGTVCGSWKEIVAGEERFRVCDECGHTEWCCLGGMPSSYWEEVPFSRVKQELRLAKQAHVNERIRQREIARGKARALEYLAKQGMSGFKNSPSEAEKT